MFPARNPSLTRHHEIALEVMKQISDFSGHFAQWAVEARDDHISPCSNKAGAKHLSYLVDALRRVLVLEVESGRLPKEAKELARREALYIALHDYFGVNAREMADIG